MTTDLTRPERKSGIRWMAAIYATHSWTGLIFGWLLFVCCVSGTLVVYKFPVKAWANPAVVSAPADDRYGPDWALAVMRAHVPDAEVGLFAFPSDGYSVHNYTLEAKDETGRTIRYWLNPATGRIQQGLQSDYADFVQRLHANLYLGRPGRWFVGALGVAMTVSLIAGLLFHWRRIGRDLFRLRLNSHSRQAWSDLHKVFGVWALPFYLVVALTGAWLGLETLLTEPGPAPFELTGDGPAEPASIERLLQAARSVAPDLTPTHVNFADFGTEGSTVRVHGTVPGLDLVQDGRTFVVLDATTAQPITVVDPTKQSLWPRVLAMMRPLHYGYFGGGWTEALYFVLGAGSSALVLSGLVVWAERDKRKRLGPAGADRSTAMERLNIGIAGGLLVTLMAMACVTAAARHPQLATVFTGVGDLRYLGTQDPFSGRAMAPELAVFFLLWLICAAALACLRPRRGWRGALTAIAALCLLLPIVSAWSVGGPSADFGRGLGESLGIALVSLVLAAGAGWLASRLTTPSPNRAASPRLPATS